MLPNPWAWRSHAQLALQLRDRLRAKANVGAGRAKASFGQRLDLIQREEECLGAPEMETVHEMTDCVIMPPLRSKDRQYDP